jgi:hypothetical protein
MSLLKSDWGQSAQDELQRLREESARLKDSLTRHRIPWEEPSIIEAEAR